MEYRSLFETDTESLLNEIGTLDQQNSQSNASTNATTTVYNNSNANATNPQIMSSYSSQQIVNPHQMTTTTQTHMSASYQTNSLPQQQASVLSNQTSVTPTPHHLQPPHLQQNMSSPYMMNPNQSQYYQQSNTQIPSNMLVTQSLKNSGMGYMHGQMGPPPAQPHQTSQPQQQQQTPPNMSIPPMAGPQNSTNPTSTTIQNVQINVQNNFNIAKNIQQMPAGVNNTSTNLQSQNPNQMTGQQTAWNMPPNPQQQYQQQMNQNNPTLASSQLQYKTQQPPTSGQPVMNNLQQPQQIQSQQLMKMNQYNLNKPSTPPTQTQVGSLAPQATYPNSNLNQSYQTGQMMQKPPQMNAYQQPPNQTVNPQMNPQQQQQQQHQQIPATQHSNYPYMNSNQLPQQQQQQAKLSAIPPHMQPPSQQQYVPNQQQQQPNQSMYNGTGSPISPLSPALNGQQIRPQMNSNQMQMSQYQQPQQQQQQQQQQVKPNTSIPMQPNAYTTQPNNMLGVNVNQNVMNQAQISPNRSGSMNPQQTGYFQPQMQPNQSNMYPQYQQQQQQPVAQQSNQYLQQPYANYNAQTNVNYQNQNMANRMNYPNQIPPNSNLQQSTLNNNNYSLASAASVDSNPTTITTTTNEITPTKGRGKGKKNNSNDLSPDNEQTEPKVKGKRGPGKNSKKNQDNQQSASEQASPVPQQAPPQNVVQQQFQQPSRPPSQSNPMLMQQQYQNMSLKPSPTQNKPPTPIYSNSSSVAPPTTPVSNSYTNPNLNMNSPLLRQDLNQASPVSSSLSPNTHPMTTNSVSNTYQINSTVLQPTSTTTNAAISNTSVYQQTPLQMQQNNQIIQPITQASSQQIQPNANVPYTQTTNSMYMQPPLPQPPTNNQQMMSQQQYIKKPDEISPNTYSANTSLNMSKPTGFIPAPPPPHQTTQVENLNSQNSSISNNLITQQQQQQQQPLVSSQIVNTNTSNYQINSFNPPPNNYMTNQQFANIPKDPSMQQTSLNTQSQPMFMQPNNVQLMNNNVQSNEVQKPIETNTNNTTFSNQTPYDPTKLNPTQLLPNSNSSVSVQYSINSTVSFIGQQQQLINDNLNSSQSNTSGTEKKQSPTGKKLTKKQLLQQQQQQQGLTDDSDTSPVKKTQRKIRPKKDSLNTSMSSSSSAADLNNPTILCNTSNSELKPPEASTEVTSEATSNTLSATTNANIEATIDDLMKQYKSKKKTNKIKQESKQSGDEGDQSEDENDQEDADDEDNDETLKDTTLDLEENGKTKTKKTPKRQNKKKKLSETTGENIHEAVNAESAESGEAKKRRKYTKKKPTISQMDELSLSTLDATNLDSNLDASNLNKMGDESLSQAADATNDESGAKKRGKKAAKDTNGDVIIASSNRSGVGRKKSSAQLVKLMKKRKKRKRTSSGEEEVDDDDSDEYELPVTTAYKSNKKEETPVNATEATSSGDGVTNSEAITNDEAAAKLLQATESRRSTRAKPTKKAKYTDEIKDEDLLLPPTEADLAAENEPVEVQNSNIVLTSQDSLVVDKILGMRLFKRKTKRKKEKKTQPVEEVSADLKEETKKGDEKEENKMDVDQPKSDETDATVKEKKEESVPIEPAVASPKTDPVVESTKLEEVKLETADNTKQSEEAKENKTDNVEPNEETKKETSEIEAKSDDKTEEEIKHEKVEEIKEENQKEPVKEEEYEESEYEEDGGEIEVEEFYVKYKNFSYVHCEWRTRDELFASDKRIDQKIKRFRLKKSQQAQYDWDNTNNEYNNEDDELFNPDYVEVDRVLDVYDMEDPVEPNTKHRYLLIKWKTLPYDESSWELETDIKAAKKTERFYKFNTLVPEVHQKFVPRPKPDRWNQLKESRVYKNGNQLREYQLEGINWLTFCWLNGRNCILADEMGLGKTIQSITFLQEIAHYGVNGPYLVLVPLSTIGNWMREFETWTDFNAIVYHGSATSRQMIQDYEFYFKENGTSPDVSNSIAINPDTSKKNVVKFNALITTYEVLLSDVQLFCQFKWRNVIIDEAHRLKNKNCKLMEGLRYMDVEHKVLLTGTPLQNNVEELFSLLHFLEPQQFNSSQEFLEEFGDLKTDTQVTKLQALLKPMMLRRLKEDVEKNLAAKEETIVEVELTNTQKKYYRAILEKNFEFLYKGATSSNVPNLMNTMMELRKCCNHPYLIDGAEDQIVNEHLERNKISSESNDRVGLKAMVQASGKLVLVDKLLPKLKAGGHKVLIFSQMIRVLDILEDYLIQMRFTYERLDGRIRGEMRQEAIDRYSKPDSDRFAFLLCTRAGGLGINLTAADTVIIYDSDWNPQNDLQAQARCHRIGQKKSVKIYRLITRNTYEREMFDKASLKLGLDKAILQSMRNEDKFNQKEEKNNLQLSKKEIEDLLKKGAYGAIMEDDTVADKFCEEDIDKILQQRTTVIQIEGGEKGSTFSKASFQTSETSDISIDDPEFWQKWAKRAEIDIEEKLNPRDERIIYEPRRRTQTRRYGGPDDLLEEVSDYSSSDTDEQNENKDQTEKDATNGKDGRKRGKKSKRGRNGDGDFGDWNETNKDEEENTNNNSVWSRDECYKVEKNLLIFGWSRWPKVLKHCEFSAKKKGGVQTEQDVESLSRCIIAYVLKNFHGDESIKQFALELIDPYKSKFAELKNNFGLSGPAPKVSRRGRTRKEEKKNAKLIYDDDHIAEQVKLLADDLLNQVCQETSSEPVKEETTEMTKPLESPEERLAKLASLEWASNADDLLGDENYKKHLVRQANRILLKLKTLAYIKNDIIGDENAALIDEDVNESEINIKYIDLPEVLADLPTEWWDKSCDKSMVIGVYKHGYEKYYKMRLDPTLVFLSLCGPPDAKDLLAEQQEQDDDLENGDAMDTDLTSAATPAAPAKSKGRNKNKNNVEKKFPSVSELNNRLRRLIASHQKFKKQELLMSKRNAERQEKRLSKLASTQERAVIRQMEKQSKWSRREEQNFYRAISSFGVDCVDRKNNLFLWDRFKEIAQLDKKLDDTLTDYFISFYYMCKKVCNKLTDEDVLPVNEVQVEVISEERASRCIQRVELLNKVRIDVLKHENFNSWISTRCMPSSDLPDWFVPCKHDLDLVKAAAKYGITRTEFYYLNDAEFSFKESLAKYMKHIEDLMNEDNKNDQSGVVNTDPIQYYFQNQSKIQQTFKELLGKQAKKLEIVEEEEEEEDEEEQEEQNDESNLDDCEIIKKIINSIIDQIEDPNQKKLVKKTNKKLAKKKTTKKEKVKQEITEPSKTDESSILASSFFNNSAVPMIMWPKDRVMTNRLENIIYMFENNGEWPQRSIFNYPNGNPLPNTPTAPILSNSLSISNLIMPNVSQLTDQRKSMISPMLGDNGSIDAINDEYYDQESSQNDPDFYGQSSKYQKPKRGRPPKLDLPQIASSLGVNASASTTGIPADPAHKIRNLLAGDSNGRFNNYGDGNSSDDDNDDYVMKKPPPPSIKDTKPSGFLEPGEIMRPKSSRSSKPSFGLSDLEINELKKTPNVNNNNGNNNNNNSNKRINKQPIVDSNSTIPGMMPFNDEATATALAAMFLAPGQDPDERISVVNVENGTRLTGNKAPKRSELPMWLISHPNYLPDEQEIINLALKNSLMSAAAAAAAATTSTQNEEIDRGRRMNKPNKLSHSSTPHEFMSKDNEDSASPPPLPPPPNTSRSFMDSRSRSNQSDSSKMKNEPKNQSSASNNDKLNSNNNNNNNNKNSSNNNNSNSNENYYPDIVLFNKQSGKKITGAKVPNWKALCSLLEKNTQVFIDPSCNETLKTKFGRNPIPDIIKSRLINPSSKSNKQVRGESNSSSARSTPPPPLVQQSNKQSANLSTSSKSKPSKKEDESIEDRKLNNSKQITEQPPVFNPFSPSSAAQLQSLTDLLGAAAGGDFNNPLASFMAAAMAAQNSSDPSATLPFGGLGAGTPGFNPFLLPPFAPPPTGAAASTVPGFNPLLADIFKDFGGKMPNGLDMNSLEDLALSLANGQQQQQQQQQKGKSSNDQSVSTNKTREETKPKSQPPKEIHNESTRDLRKKPQTPAQTASSSSSFDRKNVVDRHERNERSDRNDRHDNYKNEKSKDSKPSSSSNTSINNTRPPSTSSSASNGSKTINDSKSTKDIKSSLNNSSNNNANNNNNNNKQGIKRPHPDSASSSSSRQSKKERNAEQIDQNANVAALMMEQEKFMQEMINLSQFAGLQNNPFFFGNPAGAFPTPPIPGLPPAPKNSKSSRTARSPSPANGNARDRSISPASSIASNMSQQPPLDINLFMNNLLNYQMLGGAAGSSSFAAAIPPPLLPGLPGMPNDLSKMPVDFLTALTAAANGSAAGMGGLDPNIFSALAQMNSLSANAMNEEESKESSHKAKSSSMSSMNNKPTTSKSSSHHSSHGNNGSSSSQSKHMSQNVNNKLSSSLNQKPSSSNTSSHQMNKSTINSSKHSSGSSSMNNPKKSSHDDIHHGLDLRIKNPEDSKSKLKQSKH